MKESSWFVTLPIGKREWCKTHVNLAKQIFFPAPGHLEAAYFECSLKCYMKASFSLEFYFLQDSAAFITF